MIIQYDKKAKKFIEAQDRITKKRLKTGIEGLTFNPPKGDIKIMQGYNDNRQRLRIGKYRIIYKYIADNAIEILHIMNIDSRGDIYKR
ncbi:MAG: type II toxin-antitoxin system RelE family toxin [Oscillospiraceae bacterium]